MIISVCGSQGQGKSTVLQRLQDSNYSVVKNKTARSILEAWGVSLEEIYSDKTMCVKFHEEILYRHSILCKDYKESDEIHFIERSYADIFSYALAVLGPFNTYSTWLNQFYEKCKSQQQDFAAIIYLTGRQYTPEHDGVRSTNAHFGEMIDYSIQKYLKYFTIDKIVFSIDSPSLEERFQQIVKISQTYFEDIHEN